MSKNMNEDNIRIAAYYIWEQAGRPEGAEKDCWLQACEQLFKPKKEKAVAKKESKPVVKVTAPKVPAKAAAKPVAKVAAKPVAKPAAKAAKPAAASAPFYGIKK